MAIHCIHCGTELPDVAQFCLTCGKPPRGEAPAGAAPGVSASPPETYSAYLNAPTVRSDGPSATDPLTPPPPPPSSYYSTESLYPPGPAAASPASSPAQRASRRGLWIALAVIALVLVAGSGGVVYYFATRSTPTKTLQAACDDRKSQDYQALYNLLTPELQRQLGSESQYAAGLRQFDSSKGGIVSCTVSGVSEHGSSASGTVVAKYGDGSMETDHLLLVDQNGVWKISGATP